MPQAGSISPAASTDDPTSPNYNAEVAAEQQSLSGPASRGPAVTYGGQLAQLTSLSSLDSQNGASSTTQGVTAPAQNTALSAQNSAALTSDDTDASGSATGASSSTQTTNPDAAQNQPQNPNSQVGRVLLVQSYLPGSFVNLSA
ncbi:MAG: hypothetical protein WDN45_12050 [Caulobacteraceae bacterium]